MRSFLNKLLLWGSTFLYLLGETAQTQPIPLIPHAEPSFEPLPDLPSLKAQEFWEGTPPSIVETYFPKLPTQLTSPLLQHFRSEILKEKYTPLLHTPSYKQAYLLLLMDGGQLKQAKDFLLEETFQDKDIFLLNILWLEGETKQTCEKITNFLRTSPQDEWKKQNIYCLYLKGEKERGKIAAELLSETHPEDFPLMNALFDPSSLPPFDPSFVKSPFLLTVWSAIGHDIPRDTLHTLPPSFLALISRAEKIPIETRLFAGLKAFKEGALEREVVLGIIKDAPQDNFFQKLAQEFASPKTESLRPLLEIAWNTHQLDLVALLFKPLLSKISPSPETLSLAPYLIRAFLSVQEKELAQKWGNFYLRESPDEAIALLPLLHLALSHVTWSEIQLKAWQTYQSRSFPEKAAQNSYLLRHILEALGETSGSALKGEPLSPSWRQEQTLFDEKDVALLDSATASHRKGEILLLTLTIIGNTPFKEINPHKFIRILRALHKGGYSQEAHALAVEFLLEKGF